MRDTHDRIFFFPFPPTLWRNDLLLSREVSSLGLLILSVFQSFPDPAAFRVTFFEGIPVPPLGFFFFDLFKFRKTPKCQVGVVIILPTPRSGELAHDFYPQCPLLSFSCSLLAFFSNQGYVAITQECCCQ